MKQNDALRILGLDKFSAQGPEFYANTISAHLRTSHLHIHKPHKHDFFATFLFTKGSGIHEIDFTAHAVKPGMLFVLSPGQTHHWQLSADAEGVVFFHTQAFYETHYLDGSLRDFVFFSTIENQDAIQLDPSGLEEILPLFTKLLATNLGKYLRKKQLALSLISQIYIELEMQLAPSKLHVVKAHPGYHMKFHKFEDIVEKNSMSGKSAKWYAEQMNMTAKHLNRINMLMVGRTTSGIIADRVILEAKRIWVHTDKNLSETAYSLGYADYAHFSKMFKARTGQTPSEFVKSYT